MNEFDQQTFIEDSIVDGHGPWYLHVENPEELQHSWEPIINDWAAVLKPAILRHSRRWDCVVQAGGWQGAYPLLLSDMFAAVHTFEPDPMNFHCLVKNTQRPNIYKFQAALSNASGAVIFEQTESSGQHRVLHNRHDMYNMEIKNRFGVPALSIDSLRLPDCSFIMLDVENYENQVIEGAMQTIVRYLPLICIEKSFLPENDARIINSLRLLGYSVVEDLHTNIFLSAGK